MTAAAAEPALESKFLGRVAPFLIFAVVLVVVPFLVESRSAYSLLNATGVYIVFALSYNMLLGQTGMLSFGHAVYFGLGGYAAMHAMNWIEEAQYGDGGFWAGVPVAALPIVGFAGGLVAGAVIGYPSCRRAGTPFAMISLGVGELVAAAGFMFTSVFGGEEGVSGDRMVGPEIFGLSFGPIDEVYWLIAAWTMIGAVLMFAWTRTPMGRLANATRDNPQRVQFIGYDPDRVRYMTFIASGGFAGMAGGMAAINYEIFTPESLGLVPSGLVLLMTYIGGVRLFWGPIVGAILITYMQTNLSDYSEAWLFYLGLLFVAVVMYAPNGVSGVIAGAVRGAGRPGFAALIRTWIMDAAALLIAFAGLVVLVELGLRRSNGYGETLDLFGLEMSYAQVWPWLLGIALLIGGVALHRALTPARRRAEDASAEAEQAEAEAKAELAAELKGETR